LNSHLRICRYINQRWPNGWCPAPPAPPMSSHQEVQVMPTIIRAAGIGLLLLNLSADLIASSIITHPPSVSSGASGFLDGSVTGSGSANYQQSPVPSDRSQGTLSAHQTAEGTVSFSQEAVLQAAPRRVAEQTVGQSYNGSDGIRSSRNLST